VGGYSLTVNTAAIPGELKSIPNWCVWRYEADVVRERVSKPSFDPKTGEKAFPNAPETWAPFWQAVQVYERVGQYALLEEAPFDGVALALTEDLGILGVDIDHLDRWPNRGDAWDLVRALNSYTELSPSGLGYRIFCYATMPEGRRVREYVQMGSNRIFTVTGNTLNVRPHLEHRQDAVEDVHHYWLGTEYARPRSSSSRLHPHDE
jgi:putative DNA primase/helicase